MFGAKLSWCQIVRCQIVLVPNCPGARLSTFIILVPNCPLYYLGAKLSYNLQRCTWIANKILAIPSVYLISFEVSFHPTPPVTFLWNNTLIRDILMVCPANYLFTLVWRLPPFPSCHPILPEVPNSGHIPWPCQWHANSNGSGKPIVKPVWYPMEQAGYFHGAKRAKPRHPEWSTNSKGEHHESSTNWNATDNTKRIIKPHIGQFSATSCAQLRHKPEVITCGNILCTTFFSQAKGGQPNAMGR